MPIQEQIKHLTDLPPADRLELIGVLWDSLSAPDDLVLDPETMAELDRRLAAHRADPSDCVTWEEAKARITGRNRE